jgi:hypothetical protein
VSAFYNMQFKGAMKVHRADKRFEAQTRAARTPFERSERHAEAFHSEEGRRCPVTTCKL